MRLNRFIALSTSKSRRTADALIESGHVMVNNQLATIGQDVQPGDSVTLDGEQLNLQTATRTILLNKPPGYVCSRNGQGSATIYELLSPELHDLKPVGRLDKESSGLLLLTNDGQLAHQLTHPSFQKTKKYEVKLNRPLDQSDETNIQEKGVMLDDGLSKLALKCLSRDRVAWQISMHEGRNRQIRRTFATLGYGVKKLNRTTFGQFKLDQLAAGQWRLLAPPESEDKNQALT